MWLEAADNEQPVIMGLGALDPAGRGVSRASVRTVPSAQGNKRLVCRQRERNTV